MHYMYQIYCPLAILNKEYQFIHHDLSPNNVLIYKPGQKDKIKVSNEKIDQYITMNYHYSNVDTVTFNTFGIVKIIDFGRCKFTDTTTDPKNPVSTDILIKETERNGCSTLYDELQNFKHPNVEQSKNDLYLIQFIAYYLIGEFEAPYELGGIIGTKFSNTFKNQTNQQIINVHQMHQVLKNYIQGNKAFQDLNTSLFQNKTCLGVMDIWVDGTGRDMTYTPIK